LLALGNAELCEHWLRAMPLDEPSRESLRQGIPAELRERQATRQAQLERNLSYLEGYFPEAVATLRETEPASDLFALELRDQPWLLKAFGRDWATERQDYPLLVRARGLALSEENPLTDLAGLNDALVICAEQGQDHVWLGSIVKLAMFAINVISQPSLLTLHGWRRVTFLQEQDVAALVCWLGAIELEPWFDREQVRLTVGSDAAGELVRGVVDNLDQAVPELGIGVSAEARRQVLQQRLHKLSRAPELFAALERRYLEHPERLRAVLQERRRPLKIMVMTSRYTTVLQHVARDLAEGFEQLGHEISVLSEERAGEGMIAFRTAERLLQLEPDLVFLLDHIRPEYAGLLPSGLPVVTWVLDELPALKDPAAIAQLGSLDLAYGFNGAVERSFRAIGYPHVDQLPFAVNPARYQPEPPQADAHGIAFTTHIGQFSQDPVGAPGLNSVLARRFDAEPDIPLEMPRIEPILQAAMAELGLAASAEASRHLAYHGLQLARQQDRERVAQRIVRAGLPLSVYGLGWDAMPEFKAMAGGVVPPGPELRRVYRKHRAVLHINRGCNIHPRVLETMCSGGLVIARWDPVDDVPGETRDQLGDDLPLFRNHEEMLALFQRAVHDDTFRTDLVLRGQARVLEQHTYKVRARKVLAGLAELVEQHLRRRSQAQSGTGARVQP
jgi:spore maturation protein CgeB